VSIRKRNWVNKDGQQEAWVVDYRDQQGNRRLRTFARKYEAVEFETKMRAEKRDGTHVPDSASVTVETAGKLWTDHCANEGLERTTVDQYRQHLELHIKPFLGPAKLSRLTVPRVRQFQDELRDGGRSPAMIRAVTGSLGALLADAQEQHLVVRNVVHEFRANRRRRHKDAHHRRHRKRLKVGIDIPTPDEARTFIAHLKEHWRPLLMTMVFTGLRGSEARGLRWIDLDLDKSELHVRQRADKYNQIGPPKSEEGQRTIPLPPMVKAELIKWKEKCPKRKTGRHDKVGKLEFVFPNGSGNIENHGNIMRRGLIPTMIAAGLVVPVLNDDGTPKLDEKRKPVMEAKYTGLHTLRHFFASWCINRKEDGGLALTPKMVQERLGHASIQMTLDTYGHLFPRQDDAEELAGAERLLIGETA
jgi:integrase